MRKLNPFTTILSGLMIASFVTSPPASAANYQRKNPSQIPPTTKASYKGEIAASSAPKPSYKGEIGPKPVPVSKPRLVLAPVTLKDGAYIGLAAGYDSYKIHQFTQFLGTTNTSFNPTINATGLIGALLAGYGHYFSNALYLGLEVFGNISEAYQSTSLEINDLTDDISYNAKFFVSWGYGANLLPGVKLSDSALVFLRLGFQVARLRGQENLTDNGIMVVSNTSSWSGGFSYGLGFEEAMGENLSLRGEYAHTDFRSFTATSGTEYSPSNNQFLLSLIYHFT